MRRSLHVTVAALLTLVLAGIGIAELALAESDPIVGDDFTRLVQAQDTSLQTGLSGLFPESDGFLILGPSNPTFASDLDRMIEYEKKHDLEGQIVLDSERLRGMAGSIRVICADMSALRNAMAVCDQTRAITVIDSCLTMLCDEFPDGYRGVLGEYDFGPFELRIQFHTVQQVRFMTWSRHIRTFPSDKIKKEEFERILRGEFHDRRSRYSIAVSNYLHAIDLGELDAELPIAEAFDLPQSYDFYAPPPDYVIEGYQNYKDHLNRHRGIDTDFAHGILAFIATDSLLDALKENAPEVAWPNKEAPMLQEEYRKFFERGGDVRVMQTLTTGGFDTLRAGEYFFAVGLNGKIRFGRELLREEVQRLEEETGRKVPRANHAFLFHGEPILTAGAFFIEGDETPRLTEVNAQSGHYFYSNVSETIREDIAVYSNEYLLTLGHFFKALDRLGIDYDEILIRKM